MPRNALGTGTERPDPGTGSSAQQPPQAPVPLGRRRRSERRRLAAGPSSSLRASAQVDIDLIDPSPYQPRTRFANRRLRSWRARSIASGSFSRWSCAGSACATS